MYLFAVEDPILPVTVGQLVFNGTFNSRYIVMSQGLKMTKVVTNKQCRKIKFKKNYKMHLPDWVFVKLNYLTRKWSPWKLTFGQLHKRQETQTDIYQSLCLLTDKHYKSITTTGQQVGPSL